MILVHAWTRQNYDINSENTTVHVCVGEDDNIKQLN